MNSISYGAIILFSVIYVTVYNGENPDRFFNSHAAILVIGGCLGVFFLSTPFTTVRVLIRLLGGQAQSGTQVAHTLEVQNALRDLSQGKTVNGSNQHPLIIQAQELWEQGVDDDLFAALLTQKMDQLNHSNAQAVAAMRNLAKYPPSLGMVGTVIGLIGLFANMTPQTKNQLGPNLAVAMTATFYGLILANGIIMPLADRLHSAQLASVRMNEQIFQTLILIHRREVEPLIESSLRSYAS